MNKEEKQKIKTQLLAVNVNLSNLNVQFELLNKNLEQLESTLGVFYEELFSSPAVGLRQIEGD